MKSLQHYALVGFANSGKSTLFNLLSGESQKVGNWTGVTVSAKKQEIALAQEQIVLSDLPGLSSLVQRTEQSQDVKISHQYLLNENINALINVVDATQLKRQLYLTSQLLELGIPMIVLLNKTDRKEAISIDCDALSQELGCQVIDICAQNKESVAKVEKALLQIENTYTRKYVNNTQVESTAENGNCACTENKESIEILHKRHQWINQVVKETTLAKATKIGLSDKVDSIVLHPLLGIPIFLGMMYLLFMFAINVGGAFIDFFDILGGTLFVSYPMYYLEMLSLPLWIITIFEGIGSGVQTVATFIPIIACLFIGLSLLESSGYLARAAFVVDSVMQKIGLPGKAFVPLIVGFGCTVPAVMSTRVLDSERERITTVMMAPFMSCGARLPVYALFAAAFFPENGQNLVFMLYIIGIVAAIFTGFLLKKTTLPGNSSLNIMELPLYEAPRLSYISARVWRRTKGFVTGAGRTIVIVVCLINFVNSIGIDGTFGNQDSENSLLSQSAKLVTPVLAPMGIKEDNWQAGVGIITGIFAKEVLVATFNSLYSPSSDDDASEPSLSQSWFEAIDSIKGNLFELSPDDPLRIKVGDISDLTIASQEQEVAITTYQVMQSSFDGQLGAFSYLLFILLYTPCIAAMGAIKNEVGSRWAAFAALWSFTLAYLAATLCYQLGNFSQDPVTAIVSIILVFLIFFAIYAWLKYKGKKILTIPTRVSYS